MDTLKRIDQKYFERVCADRPFNKTLLMKDYYITVLLYLMKEISGIYFKGGTALHKMFLNYSRLSEDIDFTLTRDLEKVKEETKTIIEKSQLFERVTKDKDVEGFTRLIAHYKDFEGVEGTVFIDLNQRGKLLLPPEKHTIIHFYPEEIPAFSFPTLAQEEMIAEKVVAAIARNKPRDHFDLYRIIKVGLPINKELVKKKCKESGTVFDITKMFNQGQKLHKRWNEDMLPLLVEEVSFQEVIGTIARHFKLREEKKNKISEKRKINPQPMAGEKGYANAPLLIGGVKGVGKKLSRMKKIKKP